MESPKISTNKYLICSVAYVPSVNDTKGIDGSALTTTIVPTKFVDYCAIGATDR
jgi:hypothetical protein